MALAQIVKAQAGIPETGIPGQAKPGQMTAGVMSLSGAPAPVSPSRAQALR